jgi:hypothetical protein
MKNMRKLITFLAFAFILTFGNNLIAQTSYQDVVYLKNGSVVKGIIIEQTLNVNLKLKTSDGSLFVFEMKDIEKITKEAVGVNRNDTTQSNIDDSYSIKTTAKNFRDPTVSTVLSFLIPGVGQFYNGQTGKGVGFLLWNIGSYCLMYASILSMYKIDDYGNYTIKENNRDWAMIGLISGFSGIACWIASMIDANKSAKAINRQLGFASIQLGERTNLSFNPDFKLVNNYSSINSNSISPTYGLNIRLSF